MTRAPGTSWLELKVPPVLVWFLFAGAMLGVARAAPALAFTLPAGSLIAGALAVAGLAVGLAGVRAFRRQRTTVDPLRPGNAASIVSGGVYRLSRNPMYLGLLLTLVGWAAHLSNAAAAVLVPAFAVYLTRFQIVPEERALLAKFGPDFERYRSRVRRWI